MRICVIKGLRKRIASLFLDFLKTPEFNPEAIRYQKVHDRFVIYQSFLVQVLLGEQTTMCITAVVARNTFPPLNFFWQRP